MEILKNHNLITFNTFGVPAVAKLFVEIASEAELIQLINSPEFKNNEKLFLGGGSNVLFTKDFDGIIILNKIKGIEILEENKNDVFVKAYSGENWNDLVSFSVSLNHWGIENLSFIPGSVGATPVQNIGAYGVELKDTLEELEAFDIKTGKKRIFKKEDCNFGYRDSIFKTKYKDKYFILSITLKLSKLKKRNIIYPALQEYLKKNKIKINNSKDVSKAVTAIRKSKLPDPLIIGNAGSFFKNVFVDENKFRELQGKYPEMPYFREKYTSPQPEPLQGEGEYKIPAGWLIEQCGWKGKRVGNVGVHDKQALVLVNHGGATGLEIKNFAESVMDSVYSKFGLKLVPEVNLIL